MSSEAPGKADRPGGFPAAAWTGDPYGKGTPAGGFSAEAWTGTLPQAVTLPPPDRERAERRFQAILLFCAVLAMWVGWWFLLSLHSPLTPHPPSGHTEALQLIQRGGATLYVKPWEAAVSTGLAFAAFIVPAAWFAWDAVRRRMKR